VRFVCCERGKEKPWGKILWCVSVELDKADDDEEDSDDDDEEDSDEDEEEDGKKTAGKLQDDDDID
jgi:hypothetical protein